jgi:hypothetical protein
VASIATHNAPGGRFETLSMFAPAAVVLLAAVGSAFAAGFLIGRMLL